jgi:MFS family permease
MSQQMQKKSLINLITMNVYWLGLSFMWNSIHPIVLPAVLLHIVPETKKNTYLGLLTFVGLVIAMVIQPISGAISDRLRSPIGRRRPLAILGTSLDLVFIALLAWSGNLFVIILGYVGLQLTSNIAHGPMQALIPDMVPDEQLGLASGLKNLLDMAGLIIASLAAGALLMPEDRYPVLIMVVVMVLLIICSLVTFIFSRESTSMREDGDNAKFSLKQIFSIDLKTNSSYFWLILSRFLFLVGIYGVQTFAQYYIRDVFQVINPVKATGDLMASLALSLVICSLLGGWITDRIGARKVIYLASVIAAVGAFLLIFASNLLMLTLYAAVLGAGIGLYLSSNWALASRLAPRAEAGMYLGLTNLATAGASALSKLGGIPIDIINNAYPGKFYGYSGLFFLGGLFSIISMLLLKNIKERPIQKTNHKRIA